MKLHLSIEYGTHWGEQVVVLVTMTRARGVKVTERYTMETQDGMHWRIDQQLPYRDITTLEYSYAIAQGEKLTRHEWREVPRRFNAMDALTYHCPDQWRDIPELSYMYSSAYKHAMHLPEADEPRFAYFDKTLIFRVQAPQLKNGEALALIGSQPALGAWSQQMALRMQRSAGHEWTLSISAASLYLPFEYKYVVVDERTGQLLRWEEGENRLSPSKVVEQGMVLVINDSQIHLQADHWKTAGVVVPVFSLRSEKSQGIGDFGDLRRMADWAAKTGMHMIQLLPIYDTTKTHLRADSYPYNSISIYALHPLYLDLSQLPAIEDAAFMEEYEQERVRLNELPQVDYEATDVLKHKYLHRLYEQEGEKALQSKESTQFAQRNNFWLTPYCAFSMLRDANGTCDFSTWPEYSVYRAEDIERLATERTREMGYYAYLQYLLDLQLSETIAYARQNGVLLKGDIPIGISRYSVEAWVEPHYFNMNGSAGAPPDDFSANGQNWGFPTYNWERMAEDGYQWWVRRLQKMAEYFDAYRIDHVLGFFRIWQIPTHSVHGLLGHFVPALPLSAEDIADAGLNFSVQRMTQPYITDAVLDATFGALLPTAEAFVEQAEDGTYKLREAYATQRQVETAFAGRIDEASLKLRDGLYDLINNVLFVPDSTKEGYYHPRIAVMGDSTFKALTARQQEAFRILYEDYFYHRHDSFWAQQAMQKLPALVQATGMLICAEDLGMVPACVPSVLEQLRVLSLEIQSMPKKMGVPFARIEENPYLSVSTIFTHDMPTLRGWWEEDSVRTQHYYNQVLQHDGYAPEVMPGWLCEEVVARHLYCPSMLTLISLQDWLSIDEEVRYACPDDERINVPADPNHYWRYRMHLTIEALMQNEALTSRIAQLVQRAGR